MGDCWKIRSTPYTILGGLFREVRGKFLMYLDWNIFMVLMKRSTIKSLFENIKMVFAVCKIFRKLPSCNLAKILILQNPAEKIEKTSTSHLSNRWSERFSILICKIIDFIILVYTDPIYFKIINQ